MREYFKKTDINLNQITIPSLDLEKSIPFYEKLGLNLIVKSLPNYARFVCPDGASTFSIHRIELIHLGELTIQKKNEYGIDE